MTWQLTESLDEFEHAAAAHLLADPIRQTVPLSVLTSLRHAGPSAFGHEPPVLGWHCREDGTVDGVVLQTPPYPLLLSSIPAGSIVGLLALLEAGRGLPAAVTLDAASEAPFLAAWAASTGGSGSARMRQRLFRLGSLVVPDPGPPGVARVAGPADTELLLAWHDAFAQEAGTAASGTNRIVADRLSHGGLMLWEVASQPVAMAGTNRAVAGVVRVSGVYTAPDQRRRGYGAAVTAAVTLAAQAGGATEVVLFTDLANPTSNAIYQRLGYRPVEDRVLLELTADVTSGQAVSSE
jgi:GNAT superfamily N-acetyltransferase